MFVPLAGGRCVDEIEEQTRLGIVRRLRAIQQALGRSDREMGEAAGGISRARWSNYVAKERDNWRRPSVEALMALYQSVGVSAEFVWLGDGRQIDDRLLRKIHTAMALPKEPKRGRPRHR